MFRKVDFPPKREIRATSANILNKHNDLFKSLTRGFQENQLLNEHT